MMDVAVRLALSPLALFLFVFTPLALSRCPVLLAQLGKLQLGKLKRR